MTRHLIAACVLAAALTSTPHASPSSVGHGLQAVPTAPKNDYGDGKTWLCKPGRSTDACVVDQTTTIVAADGKLTREAWKADPGAPIDCFYVYPTVSLDPGGNSDMTAGPEETNVVRVQFARFASVCRPYAPLYRSATLTALRSAASASPIAADRVLAYNDVRDAWNYYLEHDNNGRGVVLIGHSQGSGVLTQLIRNEIDGKPVQSKIVSALLLGTSLAVQKGKDVGAFQHIPLCHTATQIGCAIAFASFRSTIPPPDNSRFGRVPGAGAQAACVNPAALGGGSGEPHAYLSAGGPSISGSSAAPAAWVTPSKPIDTPFVSVPGLLTAQCVANDKGSYLEVTVHGNPADPRIDDIAGDVTTNGQVNASWGLHLIDVHLAMGNLVDIVRQQGKAYLTQKSQ